MHSRLFCVSRLIVGCSLVVAVPPPPLCLAAFVAASRCSVFFLCASVVSGFRSFPALAALGHFAVCCLYFRPPASRLAVRSRLFRVCRLPVGCYPVFAAPPPLLCLAEFVAASWCSVFFFVVRPSSLRFSPVSGPGCPGPWRCRLFVLLVICFSASRALSPRLCVPPHRWLLSGGCCPPPLLFVALSSSLGAPFFFRSFVSRP